MRRSTFYLMLVTVLIVGRQSMAQVGIGTAEPSTDLEIANAGSNTFEATEARLTLFSDGVSASPRLSFLRSHSPVLEDDTSASAITLNNDILGRVSFAGVRMNGSGGSVSGAGWIEMIQKGTPNSTGVPGQMRFVTSNGLGNRTERMVIDPDGKIGIGTTAPTNTLHVYSAPGAALLLQGDDGWVGMELKDGAANQVGVFGFMNNGNGIGSLDITNRKAGGMISFYTEDAAARSVSSKMVITNEGNVGIGTDNPVNRLEVNGRIFLSGTEPMINFMNNSGVTDRMIIRKNPNNFGEINVLSNHELRLRTNDTDRIIIEEDGDIDMRGNQVKSFRIENRTSDPASPAVGQMWLRTDL